MKMFHKTKMKKIINVIISDIKWGKKKPTISLIRHDLIHYFFREMYTDNLFRADEKTELKTNCYIKGFVRDVWQYLSDCYEFVYSKKCLEIIRNELNEAKQISKERSVIE